VTSQVFFKLKSNFSTLFAQIINEYNHDVYGFNNDQAFPSMRTPATIHHIDTLHSNTFDDNENAVNHELYYNFAPNSQEYDGGFFYNALGNGASNNVDLSVF